jgi:hypothetical protein
MSYYFHFHNTMLSCAVPIDYISASEFSCFFVCYSIKSWSICCTVHLSYYAKVFFIPLMVQPGTHYQITQWLGRISELHGYNLSRTSEGVMKCV